MAVTKKMTIQWLAFWITSHGGAMTAAEISNSIPFTTRRGMPGRWSGRSPAWIGAAIAPLIDHEVDVEGEVIKIVRNREPTGNHNGRAYRFRVVRRGRAIDNSAYAKDMEVRELKATLAIVRAAVMGLPPSRELSVALTKLDEAEMWLAKGGY
jgi:hypothetical protein